MFYDVWSENHAALFKKTDESSFKFTKIILWLKQKKFCPSVDKAVRLMTPSNISLNTRLCTGTHLSKDFYKKTVVLA